MSKRLDQPTWDLLLESYRSDPGNHSAASRHALVQRKTAKRAWEVGCPGKPWGLQAIKDMVAADADLARGRLQLEADQAELAGDQEALEAERDREAVRQHAIVARKEEATLVVLARQASIRAIAGAIEASVGMRAAMKRIGTELETIAGGGPLTRKEMMDLSNLLRRYAATVREITVAGQMSMEMERLYMGEPTEIIGVQTELDTMPMQELVKMAGYQDSVLQRAQERGLVVLDGGKKPTN